MKNFGVYFFSTFSITSKVACIVETEEDKNETKLTFQIYMSEKYEEKDEGFFSNIKFLLSRNTS